MPIQFLRVTLENLDLLEQFIEGAGCSLGTFRYFETRPLSTVRSHVCTWLITNGTRVDAYGHLDRDGELVWLGIAVAWHARGNGLGSAMMGRLLESATQAGISRVRLSVDNKNEVAIRLYRRFNFCVITKGDRVSIYEWNADSGQGLLRS